ncbi:hypothetical protein ThrDRAFT_02767 [Frankia casuarinae]|nr:hypothetical protein CcI6DRAFT_03435 [Frankia sp. CcI6]EYT91643.1 hypothetical protein ThrDRAFT_02767 [Frankia casuarinae]KDA41238.1 hypothetical protein BMG523Draft_03923 [Frankia sp. BMG5.23]KFB03690.1 hypothetical protein ALLO2DRAFT_03494 [Frankia sp. Allo2]OAA22713.1 hypothetical protein AAY23_106164 [Frankia casuarinae]
MVRDEETGLHASCYSLEQATLAFLVRAQRAGDVRSDVRVEEVISLVTAIGWIREQAPERADHARPLLSIMTDGLRVQSRPTTDDTPGSYKTEHHPGTGS